MYWKNKSETAFKYLKQRGKAHGHNYVFHILFNATIWYAEKSGTVREFVIDNGSWELYGIFVICAQDKLSKSLKSEERTAFRHDNQVIEGWWQNVGSEQNMLQKKWATISVTH
jgi:hypothetical protein